MPYMLRIATACIAALLCLNACSSGVAQVPEPTAVPTAEPTLVPTPEPTAIPLLAEGIQIAGIDVGGLSLEEARQKLTSDLSSLTRTLDLRLGQEQFSLRLADVEFEPAYDQMLEEAKSAEKNSRIPLDISYDESALQSILADIGTSLELNPVLSIVTDTETISRSFVLSGAEALDIPGAIAQIDERMRQAGSARRVTLNTKVITESVQMPTVEQLNEQIELMAEEWPGVAGVYVYDLDKQEAIVDYNAGTAFTAASTIKAAILLNAYIHVEEFTDDLQEAVKLMIGESDNLASNDLLAASVGGYTTEEAFDGAELMTATMAELGLKNTFQYVPFEASDFIALYNIKYNVGPATGGVAPFTPASNTLRTTPYEMAQIYIMIDECAKGSGVLLDKYELITPERCEEMIEWFRSNEDKDRMVSGLPAGVDVAHKSGWIPPEIQADAGLVYSPGGNFAIAIYLYQPEKIYSDVGAERAVGHIARLVYSYYNPLIAGK
jgi:beta-lactamase class A